jgi:hypothetical protein
LQNSGFSIQQGCSKIAGNYLIGEQKVIQLWSNIPKSLLLRFLKYKKQTLDKLKQRNIKVSNFIRIAIAEKIKRDAKELEIKPKKEYCPF